jgi:nucleoside-diphosphate-sugar epimerase
MTTFSTVVVTGATSYLGAHIIDQLLYDVNKVVIGTVRDENDKFKYKALEEIAEKRTAKERLQIKQVDLENEVEVANVIKNASYVIHLASPVVFHTDKTEDPNKIVDPMVKTTENVLKACRDSGSVKKLIYTSSGGTIYSPKSYDEDHSYNEKDYNPDATKDQYPYYYGKVVCEKLVQDFHKENNAPFDYVILCPTFMLGPMLGSAMSESDLRSSVKQFYAKVKTMVQEGKGEKRTTPGLVDVRDVARVHVLALCTEEANGERVLISTPSASTWDQMVSRIRASILQSDTDDKKTLLLKEKLEKQGTFEAVGDEPKRPTKFDTTKLQRLFPEPGLRKIDDTVMDTVKYYIENELLL